MGYPIWGKNEEVKRLVFFGTTATMTLALLAIAASPSPATISLGIVAVTLWGAFLGAIARSESGKGDGNER